MNKKNFLVLVMVLLLTGGLVWFVYQDLGGDKADESSIATSSAIIINDASPENNEDMVIDVIDESKQADEKIDVPLPDLDRDLVFSADFPAETKAIVKEKLDRLVQELQIDPGNFNNWLNLGLVRKIIEDYEGAKEAWEYAKLLETNNFVVRSNLGDLYGYYLGNKQRAEENYLSALRLGPSQIYLYFKASDFYKDIMKNKAKAKEIVQLGLNHNPNNTELQALLQSLQ